MKRQGPTELPRFAAGALAVAGASSASAATVQITFTDSYVSSLTGNQLDNDFGDDGFNDISGAAHPTWVVVGLVGGGLCATAWTTQGRSVSGGFAQIAGAVVGGGGTADSQGGTAAWRGLVEIIFSDSNIDGGWRTTGYLDVLAEATAYGEKKVTVNRLIFDDASGPIGGLNATDAAFTEYTISAVPEPGSNLALLALGAGGLTLRRRLKRAA